VATSLQVLIEARDEASGPVEAFRNKLATIDKTATEGTRGIRELTRGILDELNPALGGAVGQLANVTRGATVLSGGMGTLALGVGVAVAAFVPYIAAVRESTETQGRLNIAAASFDAGPIRAKLQEAATEVETTRLRFETFTGSLLNIGRAVTDWVGWTTSASKAMADARDALAKVLPIEREQQLTEILAQQAQVAQGLATVDLPKYMRREDLDAALGGLGALTAALEQQDKAARRLIELQGARDLARSQATGEGPEAAENIRQRTAALLKLLDAQNLLRFSQAAETTDTTLSTIKTAAAQADAQHLSVMLQEIQLTKERRAELTLEAIEAERVAKITAARDNPRLAALAEEEARIKRLNVVRAETERTEVIPGFLRGLQDAEQEFGAVGARMQDVARNAADGMARGFSDGFFDVITGNFKDLPNVARSFTQSMVRSVTDELGKLVTAPILGQLRSLFTAGGLGALSLMPGAGAGSGGGPLSFLGPGAAEAATAPVVSVAGRPISTAEINVAFTQAGDQGVRALQQNQGVIAGGTTFIPTGATTELPGISQQVLSSSPSVLGRALPIAGNAAAFGLSAYGATGATSAADVGISAALGGLTGAGLGRSVGALFDAGGAGAGFGAFAGAGINASLALVAKQEADRAAAKQRQAAEAARAAGAGGDLVSSASGASSVADLFRRITAFGSGYTGGTANPAVPVSVQTPGGPAAVGTPNPTYPVGGVLDILRNPGSLQANIQAGVNPALLSGPNAATSKALQDRATDLVTQFRQTEQGVGVTQQDLVPGGLLRRTTVPASRIDQLSPTADLSIDELALNALSDDDKAVLLLDVLSRVAADKDIQSTISDGATGQIVSITRVARSSIGLPPATTPVPAPVTTGSPAVTPPGASTGELLTAGGALTLGLAASLADPSSLINQILPAGFTGPDLAALVARLVSPDAAVGTAITWANGSTSNIGGDVLSSLNAGLQAEGGDFVAASLASPSGSIPGFGLGDAVAAAGGLQALFSLVQGAQQGDPVSILAGLAQVYGSLSSLFPSTVPSALSAIGGVAADAVAAVAPELATSLVQAAGGTISGATATGTELAAALAPLASEVLAGAAPIIAGLITWAMVKDQVKDERSWAVIGQLATALQSRAQASITGALQVFYALRQGGVTDPAALKRAITIGSNALLTYYQTAQGPAGPVSLADFYKRTGQDPKPLQQAVAQLQQYIVDATAYLSSQGASYQELGALGANFDQPGLRVPPGVVWEAPFYAQHGAQFTAEADQFIASGLGGAAAVQPTFDYGSGQWITPMAGDVAYRDAAGQAIYQQNATPENLRTVSGGETAKFGGPLWVMMAALGLDALAPTPWVPGAAAQAVPLQYDPWAIFRSMTPAQLATVLASLGGPLGPTTTGAGEAGGGSSSDSGI
jgi:hypothetical protein